MVELVDTLGLSPNALGRESSNLSGDTSLTTKSYIMAKEPWKVTYEIIKVNGKSYHKNPDLISEHRENIPGELKRVSEQLADKFDFAGVRSTARSLNTSEEFQFTYESDDGLRPDWVVGRQ